MAAAAAPVKVSEDTLYAEHHFSRLQEMITKAGNVYEQAQFHFYWTHHKWILKDGIAVDIGPVVAKTDIAAHLFNKKYIESYPDKVKDMIKGVYNDNKLPPIIPETDLMKTECHIMLFEAIKQ